MSRRTGVGLLALALVAVLWLTAGFTPLPYVTYTPGPTVDVLAESQGKEIIQVSGHKVYHDSGELRMTTLYVSDPEDRVTLPQLVRAYFDDDSAVYPRSAVYPPDETDEEQNRRSAVQMVSSKDTATAVALTELGYKVPVLVKVFNVDSGMPAEGKLDVSDVLLSVGDTPVDDPQDVVDAVQGATAGQPLTFRIRRAGKERTVDITPTVVDGVPRIGITPGLAHDFPFTVSVDISENIGGPSAGLMFSLAVYDTLTPGSLTGGGSVAGTGTINPDGTVGPIGGIQQKIAGARDSGADLFLVPAANCEGFGSVDTGDMRLARVASMHEALSAIESWSADPDTDLPTCEDDAS